MKEKERESINDDIKYLEENGFSVKVIEQGTKNDIEEALENPEVDLIVTSGHGKKDFVIKNDLDKAIEADQKIFEKQILGDEKGIEGRFADTLEPAFEAAKAEMMANGIDIEAKPEITYDDFAKLQFQVGEIIACEAVKKSKKLLCSQVKIGSQVRQIVSGIKNHYTAEEMVGKKVMVVTNLKPAKLAGIMSEGMILCAEDADGNLALMTPEKDMPAGAEIC